MKTGSKKCKSMLKDRIVHLDIRSKSYNYDEPVAYFGSLQNQPLVICPSQAWIINVSDMEFYKLLGYSPLIFEEKNVVKTLYLSLFTRQ